MSAEVKKMLSQEETGGSKIELFASSGTVICLNFKEKVQILPKIFRLVDPDTDVTAVFRSEDGVYHELDSDSAANLQEFEASNEEDENYNGHCHQIIQLPIRGLKQYVRVNSSQMNGEHKTSPSKDGNYSKAIILAFSI